MAGPAGFEPATSGLEEVNNFFEEVTESFRERRVSSGEKSQVEPLPYGLGYSRESDSRRNYSRGIWYDFPAWRDEFYQYLTQEKGISRKTAREYLRRLDKFFWEHKGLRTLETLRRALKKENYPQNLSKGLRNYFHFLMSRGVLNRIEHDELVAVCKLKKGGVDWKLLDDEGVRAWKKTVGDFAPRYRIPFNLILYGGLRLTEAVKIYTEFNPEKLHCEKNYCFYELGWRRGQKRSYYAFMPRFLGEELLKHGGEKVSEHTIRKHYHRHGIYPKYLRKWFVSKASEAGVLSDTIRFIIGHSISKDTLSLHYLDLLGQAKRNYPKILKTIEDALTEKEPQTNPETATTETALLKTFISGKLAQIPANL
ncbi:integrase [Thermococcus henrietii]|uniref:integrase n=1 Tax=Thermococcus henrietii TaxID=2016361 RepID=UPI000C07384C|nr:integrase [Thermococcus henrietii]